MSIFLLWFSVFSFMVLCVALVIMLMQYIKLKLPLYGWYFLLILFFEFWLIIYTILYFTEVFVILLDSQIKLIFAVIRTLVSVSFLYIITLISFIILFKKLTYKRYLYAGIPGIIHILMVIPLYVIEINIILVYLISISFYLYLLLITIVSILCVIKKNQILPFHLRCFLVISGIYWAISLVLSFPYFQTISSPLVYVFPRAAFGFIWGITEIFSSFRRQLDKERQGFTSESFFKHYGISKREQDIIIELFRGFSIKKIADRLFISEKTVETHLYNIYRKCDVSNRIELINCARRFQLREFP